MLTWLDKIPPLHVWYEGADDSWSDSPEMIWSDLPFGDESGPISYPSDSAEK